MKKIKITGQRTEESRPWLRRLEDSGGIKNTRTYEVFRTRDTDKVNILELSEETEMSYLEFKDGTKWLGRTEEVSRIFKDYKSMRGLEEATRDSDGDEDIYTLPTDIVGDDPSRGLLKTIGVHFFSVFKSALPKVGVTILAQQLDRHLISITNLFRVNEKLQLINYDAPQIDPNVPYLLLLHGTISSTVRSFGDLINEQGQLWPQIYSAYNGNVLAFEHHTLHKSPLENALELIKRLPDNIDLHILSHSRGGLIAEILARVHTSNQVFTEEEISILQNAERTDDINIITNIREQLIKKSLRVSKVIRVACPAEGTELLSNKLNTFFNVIINLTEFTPSVTGQTINQVADILLQIIEQKDDPSVLPGLEAMKSTSLFNRLMNNREFAVNSRLSIVSAQSNIRGGMLKGLAYILTNLIHWKANDFVIDTRSMYAGMPRSAPVRHLKIKSDEIHHLSFFRQAEVQSSIKMELIGNPDNNQFEERSAKPRPTSRSGRRASKKDITHTKPVILLIPGLMGSVLSGKNDSAAYWLDEQCVAGKAPHLSIFNENIEPSNLVSSSYSDLENYFLDKDFEVEIFPYDWRNSLRESGQKLKDRISDILKKTGENVNEHIPIKIIAHSTGGLLIRDLMINHEDDYRQFSERAGFKILMLGTPWKGTYKIAQFLMGQGLMFSAVRNLFQWDNENEIRDTFASFEGLIELLPQSTHHKYSDEIIEFSNAGDWKKLAKKIGAKWKDLSVDQLASVKRYWKKAAKLDEKTSKDLFKNVIYIAGQSEDTLNRYYFDEEKTVALQFGTTPLGDGITTWERGIPIHASLTYFTNTSNGSLTTDGSLFNAYHEILALGSTSDPTMKLHSNISGAPHRDSSLASTLSTASAYTRIEADLFDNYDKKQNEEDEHCGILKIDVVCADLVKSKYPVMVGHIKGPVLQGAEWAVNGALSGKPEMMLRLGLYPDEKETSEILAGNDASNFKGAIIIGLGQLENITSFVIECSVKQAVLKYVFESIDGSSPDSNGKLMEKAISTVLMSSHYGNLSTESSVESILRGVISANETLKNEGSPICIGRLEYVELYEDKARAAFLFLKELERQNTNLEIQLTDKISNRLGSRVRIHMDRTSEFHQRYTVTLKQDSKKNIIDIDKFIAEKKRNENAEFFPIRGLEFRSYAGLAREEKVEDYANHYLIHTLVEGIPDKKWNKRLSKALFEMLIPNEFKSNFKRQSNILLVLDKETAQYPWEMLTPIIDMDEPLCVRASMIRQFTTDDYPASLSFVNKKTAFLLGNPDTKGIYEELPGAEEEVKTIANILKKNQYALAYDPERIKKPSDYIMDLYADEYRIIHIAAHGVFNSGDEDLEEGQDHTAGKSKIIIGPRHQDIITTEDLCKMNYTPELAFINCCHLAKFNPEQEELYSNRYKIAASIGLSLLRHGYKMVIVAGWAVNDRAARVFAETFYEKLFSGDTFSMAVRGARKACFEADRKGNTWGAYQCYGNPDYTLSGAGNYKDDDSPYNVALEAIVDLRNFRNKVETKKGKPLEYFSKWLDKISQRITYSNFSDHPEILEMEAECHAEILQWKRALELYEKLFEGSHTYTLSAHEQYYNIKARHACNYPRGEESLDEIDSAIAGLKHMLGFRQTPEGNNLLGSAYKRLYLLNEKHLELANMVKYYEKAYLLAKSDNIADYYYPLFAYLLALYFQHDESAVQKEVITKIAPGAKNNYMSFYDRTEDELNNFRIAENFWDEISLMSVYQYQFIVANNEKNMSKILNKMKTMYRKAWKLGGTFKQRSSEIEHIKFIIKALSKKKKGVVIKEQKIKELINFRMYLEKT